MPRKSESCITDKNTHSKFRPPIQNSIPFIVKNLQCSQLIENLISEIFREHRSEISTPTAHISITNNR